MRAPLRFHECDTALDLFGFKEQVVYDIRVGTAREPLCGFISDSDTALDGVEPSEECCGFKDSLVCYIRGRTACELLCGFMNECTTLD